MTALASHKFHERILTRVSVTLVANLFRAVVSCLSGVVVARGLGASGYGDLYFLLGSFAAISQLLDMGSSSAFYTFLARRRRSWIFVMGYLAWLACQFAILAAAVGLLLPDQVVARLWLGHDRAAILLACGASFLMNHVWGALSQLAESVRWTIVTQATWMGQALIHLLLVAAAASLGWLSVPAVLWLLVAEYALLAAILGPRLVRQNLAVGADAADAQGTALRDLVAYCRPLVLYSWMGFLYAFADRWLLQRFGGSMQQGFFAVAQQFANVSLIATTSLLNVFWKEVAEAGEQQDVERLRTLYATVSRGLFTVGAWGSCLLIPYSREILRWTVGSGYEAAWLCLSLMLLYPVHQSLGQVNGTYLYATGDTRSYSTIGLFIMALSLPVTYGLLAAPSAHLPGLGLGASGLAVKMVLLQLIGVSLQVHIIARTNGWAPHYRHQALVLGSLFALGWICRGVGWVIAGAVRASGDAVVPTVLGAVAYVGSSGFLVFRTPALTGLTRDDFRRVLQPLAKWLPQTAIAKPNV